MKASKGTDFNLAKIEKGVREIIKGMGMDVNDPNYIETPERYCRFLLEMFRQKPKEFVTFPMEGCSDFILFRDHKMYTLCPHHLLPVELNVSLAYIPGKEVLGLSKLARIMHKANSVPVLQEQFVEDVCDNFYDEVKDTQGVAVYCRGQHDCTKIRGVRSDGWFITYKMKGRFSEDSTLEQRFFDLINK